LTTALTATIQNAGEQVDVNGEALRLALPLPAAKLGTGRALWPPLAKKARIDDTIQ